MRVFAEATDGAKPGFTVLSVTAGSGKSLLTRSLAVLRRRGGLAAEIYKPVAVTLKPAPTRWGPVDISVRLAAVAAGAADVSEVCDFVVTDGHLRRVDGTALGPAPVPQVSEDGVDFSALPGEVRARIERTCARRAGRAGRFLICEGAGGTSDLPVVDDVSNTRLAAYAGRPVIFVVSARQGGALPALLGVQRLLPGSVRRLVAGFLVNNAEHHEWGDRLAGRMTTATGWPCLGVVPRIPLFAHLPARGAAEPVAATWPEELSIVADFVAEHLADPLRRTLSEPLPAGGARR